MLENYISSNISYLLKRSKLKQEEFAALFDLGKGVVNQYVLRKSNPKVETIQKICTHFKITIDDFVNRPLGDDAFGRAISTVVNEPSDKYITLLEQSLQDKEEIIAGLRERLARYEVEDNKKNAS